MALGKGLSALLGNIDTGIDYISIDSIVFNPYQIRHQISNEKLNDLIASINIYGILQPLLVRPLLDGKYQLIAGERRYHAAKKLGLIQVPVIIKNYNSIEMFEVLIIENIQRIPLTPIEEGITYKKLIEDYCYTKDMISKKIGKSTDHISNMIQLTQLPEEIQDMIIDGRLSVTHALIIMMAENPLLIARQVIENNLSIKKTKKLLDKIKNQSEDSHELLQLQSTLSDLFDLNVKVHEQSGKYKIIIACKNLNDLDKLFAKISS